MVNSGLRNVPSGPLTTNSGAGNPGAGGGDMALHIAGQHVQRAISGWRQGGAGIMTGGMIHDLALSLAMLAMVALLAGAWYLYRRNGPNRQTLLMVVMALVLLGNVVIWQLPPPQTEPQTGEAASAEGAPAAR